MARHLIPSLVVGGALAVAACAEQTFDYDPALVEARIAEAVAPEDVVEVGCTGLDTLDPEIGGAVSCSGVLDDDLVELRVDVTPSAPAPADTLGVDVEILTPLFDVSTAAAAGAERLDAELGGSPIITCPRDTVVLVPSRRIECRVTADGGTAGPVDRPVTIVILDEAGAFELDLFE